MQLNGDQIQCITFDLDDTLWLCEPVILNAEFVFYSWLEHEFPLISESFDAAELVQHRRDFFTTMPDMAHDFSWLRQRWLEQLADEYGYDRERLKHEGFEVFLAARNEIRLFDGAAEVLEQVRSNYRCGTITNGNADVHRIGIDRYFDFNITASGAGASKPSPEIFQAAADAAGVAPQNILHVGDDPDRDMRGAARFGMKTLWINPQGNRWKGSHRPNAEVHMIHQMRDLLDNQSA